MPYFFLNQPKYIVKQKGQPPQIVYIYPAKSRKEPTKLKGLTIIAIIAIIISSFTLPITSTIGVLLLYIIIETVVTIFKIIKT